ncbi:MAG: ATP-binding protein [Actinomycetota bacterium]
MIRRHMTSRVVEALRDTPAVFLVGPRQAGKSTLVKALRGDSYVTLDRIAQRSAAASDPEGFVAGLPGAVVIDEVQRVPELFLALKAAIDEDRRPGRFLLTGSANALMLPTVADALPGRVEILTLWPLTQGEPEGRVDGFVDALFTRTLPSWKPVPMTPQSLYERVLRGGFPEVARRAGARRIAWFESYITTQIEREVRELTAIDSAAELMGMIRLIAARNCALLNLADVARDARLAHSTARRYLRLLEMIFMVAIVPAWATSHTTRLVRSPKIMLTDTGLAAHLLGADADRLDTDASLRGRLLEGFVATELRKQIGWSRARPSQHHFRSRRGEEVDCVLESRDGRLVGIEVKASATVRGDDFKGLRALETLAGDRFLRGVVLYTGTETAAFGRKLWALPISALWLLGSGPVGRQ